MKADEKKARSKKEVGLICKRAPNVFERSFFPSETGHPFWRASIILSKRGDSRTSQIYATRNVHAPFFSFLVFFFFIHVIHKVIYTVYSIYQPLEGFRESAMLESWAGFRGLAINCRSLLSFSEKGLD